MPTTLRQTFLKPVDRQIDGVIKADDERHLRDELEEYVLTNEISKNLSRFLDAYNAPKGPTGVWISGFFGSGKSHLLKILSLALEGRMIDGEQASDLLLAKCGDDALLKGALQKAVKTPSSSILFNIDQKAPTISKTDVDALLVVFQTVFDEMCGYFGKQAHIAQFERDLDKRKQLGAFRDAYARIAGQSWDLGREVATLEQSNIAKAFAEVSGSSDVKTDLLGEYRSNYRLSIEDFANQVKAYIDAQPPGFRLNFFVDEVGQYVADNVKLMTNLQTIAESLLTKCNGQSWIVVTAQQDLQAVLGELTASKQNDFSKIKARFPVPISLNSSNVAEVIQKRLLSKTPKAATELGALYRREVNNLGTLFRFGDGSVNLPNFRDEAHFVDSYPFVPYQYELFGEAIKGLSRYGAFQGRFSSVGERSMLAVFQEVAVKIADLSVGEIASFDRMFDGLRPALTSEAMRSIQLGEKALENPLAVRVLKALFLVKYVGQFKASVTNISILLRERFDQNSAELRKSVESALDLLEQQSYIQRQGEYYEFLTDEEKDVEKEIKSVEIDQSEIVSALNELLFDGILPQGKVAHASIGHAYPFGKYIDNTLIGSDRELKIKFITPFSSSGASESELLAASTTSDALLVWLPADNRFVSELSQYERTKKYIRQNQTGAGDTTKDKIIIEKGEQNRRRKRDLDLRAAGLVGEARLFVRGSELMVGTSNPKTRIEEGFQTLIEKVFVSLKVLKGHAYSEADVAKFALPQSDDLVTGMTEAEQDVFNFTQTNKARGINTPVSSVIEHFEKGPFGWPYAAILCQIAMLVGRGKLDASIDSNALAGADLVASLKNRASQRQLLLTPQADFSASDTRWLKTFYSDFFGKPLAANDAKAAGEATAQAFRDIVSGTEHLKYRSQGYPFAPAVEQVLSGLRLAVGQPYGWYLTTLKQEAEKLQDIKDRVLDPISRFLDSPQAAIYAEAEEFLNASRGDLRTEDLDTAAEIEKVLSDPDCFRGGAVQGLKAKTEALRSKVEQRLRDAKAGAETEISDFRTRLESLDGYAAVDTDMQAQIELAFRQAEQRINAARSAAEARDIPRQFKETHYNNLIALIARPRKPGVKEDAATPVAAEMVAISSVSVRSKAMLSSAADVDDYVGALKESLLAAIKAGKKIVL